MGVDYTGNYGIGVLLVNKDFEEGGGEYDYMDEYLDDLPKPELIETEYFEVGSASYGGGENDYYLCIVDPFKDGVDELPEKVRLFEAYLRDNSIEYVGSIDLVGGLHIW